MKGHISYKALSSSLTEEDAVLFIKKSNEWEEQGQHNNADAVYAVSVAANYEVYDRIRRRNPIMCEALRELMKEEIEKEKDIAIREGLAKGLAKGLAEGRAEGRAEAYIHSIITILSLRGTVPPKLQSRLETITDEVRLNELLSLAARAEGIPEFEKELVAKCS